MNANDEMQHQIHMEQQLLNSEVERKRHEVICSGLNGGIEPGAIRAFAEELYPDCKVDEGAVIARYQGYRSSMGQFGSIKSMQNFS